MHLGTKRWVWVRDFSTLWFALTLAVAILPAAAQEAPFRDGVVLVGFKQGIPAARQHSVIASAGAAELRTSLAGAHVLRVAPGRVQSVIQALKALPEIRYAEPDYVQHPDGAPNDPSFNLQWGFQNIGQSVNGTTGASGADERAVAAWNITVGSASTVVAVTDTGVDYTHPDLAPNMWSNPGAVNNCPAGTHGYNVLTSTCNPMDDDTQYGGHGTHVAGIIGAAGDNGVGVAGVNWVASIMALKWINSTGTGYTSDLITGLDWVVNAKKAGVNVRVVNDSATWAGTAFSQALSDTIDLLGSNDILFVTAAGNTAQNNDTTPRYPCVYDRPNQICVAASDQTDHLWISGNWGATTVNLAAPGVNIYSTLIGSYGFISGGSMACAQTSGTAALMLSLGYQPVATLRSNILNAVDVLSALSGLVATSGRLNVCKALPGCPDTATTTPVNTAAPAILGAAQQGQTLSSTAGTWSGGPASYNYQWNRCNSSGCTAIVGATAPTYTLMAAADISSTITLTVTASNSLGSGSATSVATAAITSAPAVSWTVSGSIQNGQTLSGQVQWQAFTSIASSSVSAVEFYIDGTQSWTQRQSPYYYNGSTGYLDTTTLSPGQHVFAVAATATDGTVAYYTATAGTGFSGAGISLLQSASVQATGVTSMAKAFPNNNTAGNLTIAFVRVSTTSQTVTVTDSAGNSYARAVGQVQSTDHHQIYIYYAKNVAGGPNTVTATFSGTNKHPWLAIYEFSGLSATSPLDQTAHAQGSGTAANSGPTPVTTSANELVFAGVGLPVGSSVQATPGSGYTILQQNTTGSSPGANEGQMVPVTGAYSGTFSLSASENWTAVVATFASAGQPSVPTISTSSLANGEASVSYSATLTASGGASPYTWSIASGSLPAGLALAPSTGVISGTPTTPGTSNFTVQLTDKNSQTATQVLSITINPPPAITTTSLPNGTVNVAYSATLAAGGGTTPYTWSIAAGSLPAGPTLAPSTGVISGTPTTAATSSFTAQVTDKNSQTATQALSITINAAPTAPAITTASLPNGEVSVSYSATLMASGGTTPYTWSIAAGSLPAGLTLAPSTGVISGTPTTAATSSFTAQVTDTNAQTATKALSITINPPPAITTTSLPNGTVNVAYSATLMASGGTTPYTWSIASGSLPAGLTLAPSTGVISGTPTTAVTGASFTAQVMDTNSQTAAKALSITINASGGGATIALAQSAAVQGSGVASVSQAFPNNNTAGNLIIAFVRMSTTSQTVTVTDSAGNTYQQVVSQAQTTDGHQAGIFYASNIKGGANNVKATFSSTNNHPWLAIYEYSGVSTLDQTAHAQGSSSSPNSGLTAATTSSSELVFAGLGLPSSSSVTVAAGSGYAMQSQDTIQYGSRAATEQAISTATGAYAGSFSLSGSAYWSCVVATFK